jgi:hypothetical protein
LRKASRRIGRGGGLEGREGQIYVRGAIEAAVYIGLRNMEGTAMTEIVTDEMVRTGVVEMAQHYPRVGPGVVIAIFRAMYAVRPETPTDKLIAWTRHHVANCSKCDGTKRVLVRIPGIDKLMEADCHLCTSGARILAEIDEGQANG